MAKELLTLDQVRDLSRLMRVVYAQTMAFHEHTPLGKHIKYPPIPSILSESLALHLLRGELISELSSGGFSFGSKKNEADIVFSDGRKLLQIEVKATGDKAFQRWSEGDIRSDFLVWIHFGRYFFGEGKDEAGRSELAPIDVHVVPELRRFFDKAGHVTLSDFLTRTKDARLSEKIYLEDVWARQQGLFKATS